MSLEMTTSLSYLAWASALCLILWLPYVLERIMRQGLMTVLQYKNTDAEPAVWAQRAHRAHLNLVENLAPFAALVVQAIVHIAGIAYVRTVAFFVSWLALIIMFFAVI